MTLNGLTTAFKGDYL